MTSYYNFNINKINWNNIKTYNAILFLTQFMFIYYIEVVYKRYGNVFMKFNFSDTLIYETPNWKQLRNLLPHFPLKRFKPNISDPCQFSVDWNCHFRKLSWQNVSFEVISNVLLFYLLLILSLSKFIKRTILQCWHNPDDLLLMIVLTGCTSYQ